MALKTLMAGLLCTAVFISNASADSTDPRGSHQSTADVSPSQDPVQNQLDPIFAKLKQAAAQAAGISKHLHEIATKKPADTVKEVDAAANSLAKWADTFQPNGEVASRIAEARNMAMVSRKRVQDYGADVISQSDKNEIIAAWDKALVDTDKVSNMMTEMRQKLLATLGNLRKHRTAMSELLLASQYQAAIRSLLNWLTDLDGTVTDLNRLLQDTPTS